MQQDDIAIRELLEEDTSSILKAILRATDHGVMLTGLDHTTLAVNRRFGEIFEVDIHEVVRLDAMAVREKVRRLIPDLQAWSENLKEVYKDRLRSQEDEIMLATQPTKWIRRYTGPVLGPTGAPTARLWTFLDVTNAVRLRRMREILADLSAFLDPDPREVYKRVVEGVSSFYGSNAILSILNGDTMEFHEVAGKEIVASGVRENVLEESYCQFALIASGPLVIQDASREAKFVGLLPARFGLTRYLGVPLKLSDGSQIGTLCFMDSYSDIAIDEEDVRFMSLLAMRVSAEKERERAILEREAAQRLVVESQARDLESTRHVLSAMNHAFALVGTQDDLNQTIASQTSILRGAVGYDQVGIFCSVSDGTGLFGHVATESLGTQASFLDSSAELRDLFKPVRSLVIPLKLLPGRAGFLVLASSGPSPEISSLHEAHIEAITEQVSLLLSARMLQAELDRTDQELAATQSRLIQTEKLSVVGTLAASTAHDIKNILSSISVELGFVEEDPHRTLASVRAHMDRFTILAHRLLSYSKPRMVAMGAVDLHEVIQRVLALTSGHIRVTNADVVLEESPSLPKVAGDPHQLDHMFVNLVLNAVQAMHAHGGTLTVRTVYRGGHVEVEIQDSGQGMTPETLQRLFEPFLSTRTDGFGLGLFSCRRIVEEQGGSISASSEPGKGTKFTVKLKPAGGDHEP